MLAFIFDLPVNTKLTGLYVVRQLLYNQAVYLEHSKLTKQLLEVLQVPKVKLLTGILQIEYYITFRQDTMTLVLTQMEM